MDPQPSTSRQRYFKEPQAFTLARNSILNYTCPRATDDLTSIESFFIAHATGCFLYTAGAWHFTPLTSGYERGPDFFKKTRWCRMQLSIKLFNISVILSPLRKDLSVSTWPQDLPKDLMTRFWPLLSFFWGLERWMVYWSHNSRKICGMSYELQTIT